MKVLVAIKRVIDYKALVRIKSDGKSIETNNVKMTMNPFDEIAVEEAVRLKENKIADEVIVVSIGSDASQEILRSALAMGADSGILVKADALQEPLAVAKILKKITEKTEATLVIVGKQAIDTDDNQVGQMLAALLNWPQGTYASTLDFHDQGVSVTREIDGGLETLFLKLPAVITTDLRLNEPRYLSLPNIMQAKRKPIEIILAETLNIDLIPRMTIMKLAYSQQQRKAERVDNVADLLAKLKSDSEINLCQQ